MPLLASRPLSLHASKTTRASVFEIRQLPRCHCHGRWSLHTECSGPTLAANPCCGPCRCEPVRDACRVAGAIRWRFFAPQAPGRITALLRSLPAIPGRTPARGAGGDRRSEHGCCCSGARSGGFCHWPLATMPLPWGPCHVGVGLSILVYIYIWQFSKLCENTLLY